MKKLDLSAIVENVRKLGAIKETLEHVQEAYTEGLSRLALGLNCLDTDVTIMTGVVNGGILPSYAISAGSAYYDGELFEVPAFAGTAGGGQVAVLTLVTSYKTGDPVRYSDNTDHFTHSIRKLQWSFGTSGSGIKDYLDVIRLGAKIAALSEVAAQALTAENNAKAYADSIVVGLWDDRGNYNASTNLFPATGGSGAAGAIKKGDIWTVSVIGTLGGVAVSLGDTVRAIVDTPAQTAANWAIAEANLGYTPENVINKDIDGTLAANSDTKYPSQKAVKTFANTKEPLLGYVPVQKGTGIGQLANLIKIGWSGGAVLVEVDITPQGEMVTQSNIGTSLLYDAVAHKLDAKGIIGDIGSSSSIDAVITPGVYRIYATPIAVDAFFNVLIVGKNGLTVYQSRLYFSDVWVAAVSGGAVTTNIQPALGFEGRTSSDGGTTWTGWTHV